MRKIISYTAAAVLIVLCSSCAKERSSVTNDAAKRYFDAWIHVYHPNAERTELGSYIIDETVGNGAPIDEATFLSVNYTVSDLDGNISSTSSSDIAQMLGTHSDATYYGPVYWATSEESMTAGIADAVAGMKINGKRTVAVPGWLQTVTRFSSEDEYIANVTENSPVIYTIEIVDTVMNMNYRQVQLIEKYLDNRFGEKVDSLQYGFYYKRLGDPLNENAFPEDTTVYINYTGRLLTGKVFDTTIGDTAKVHKIYSASNTYSPSEITWASDSLSITMGSSSSSVIQGFSRTLWQMRSMEKGVGVFISDLGYGSYGSGSSIPGYAPLVFEVEMVENEE
ncbi:MAG: FKBP-type peptidyl-prolyl cis-trans isomerase [Candidatus Cryptobacteroides sp.]